VAIAIFEAERLADAQRFAVHFEDALAAVIFDPVVIPDRNRLLPHLVMSRRKISTVAATIVAAFLAPTSHLAFASLALDANWTRRLT
jgi:hypothetical protein